LISVDYQRGVFGHINATSTPINACINAYVNAGCRPLWQFLHAYLQYFPCKLHSQSLFMLGNRYMRLAVQYRVHAVLYRLVQQQLLYQPMQCC
jgi:hypothetical protein